MTPWSRTISRLITLWKWCCRVWICRDRLPDARTGMAQTSLSSRAIALQVWIFAADAVEAEQFAGHLEAGDLIAPVLDQHVGLEEAAADGVDRLECLPGTVQVIAALQASARRNQLVELPQFVRLRGRSAGTARAGCSSNRRSSRLRKASLAGRIHSVDMSALFHKPAFDPRQPDYFRASDNAATNLL
jgi:hypothetical protein